MRLYLLEWSTIRATRWVLYNRPRSTSTRYFGRTAETAALALAFVLERRRLGTCTESAASSDESGLVLQTLASKGRPLSGSVLGGLDLYVGLTTSRVNLQHGDGDVLERLRLSAIFYVSQ